MMKHVTTICEGHNESCAVGENYVCPEHNLHSAYSIRRWQEWMKKKQSKGIDNMFALNLHIIWIIYCRFIMYTKLEIEKIDNIWRNNSNDISTNKRLFVNGMRFEMSSIRYHINIHFNFRFFDFVSIVSFPI